MAKKDDDAAKAAEAAAAVPAEPAAAGESKVASDKAKTAEAAATAPTPKIDIRASAEDHEAVAATASTPADPSPATELEQPSGAIIEPGVAGAVDVTHESVDANPRAGTTAEQNAIDWNDAKRAKPGDPNFAGQGLDESVYGNGVKA